MATNTPRLERRETVISAKEVLENLGTHTSNRAPEYGLYLMKVAGQKVRLFDLSNDEVIVRAENILTYTEKGFTPEVSDKALDGRTKVSILEEKGMAHRHDVVPRTESFADGPRNPRGDSERVEGAKKGGASEKPQRRATVAPPAPKSTDDDKAKAETEATS
jgi:hypothetical protein